jgi:uncharacterized membrane protein
MLGVFDAYTILKFVHVLAAVVWVGGGVAANIQGTRIRHSGDGPRLAGFARDTEWLGTHVYLPASITVLVFGVLTALRGHYSFTSTWLVIGIVGIVATSLTGSLYFGPTLKQISALTEQRGVDDAEVKEPLSRLVTVARVDLAVLVVVIADMVFKPGF